MPTTKSAPSRGVMHETPEVFISHIALEQCLAETLRETINAAFDNRVEAHAGTGAGGADLRGWAERLENRLFRSSVLLVVASRLSVQSPWVFFETGFATARGIKVIPICLPGQPPGSLPVPLVTRDARKMVLSADFGKRLMRDLKAVLGVPMKSGFRYTKLIGGLRRGLDDLRLKFRLLVAIRDRPRAACTAKKLAPVVRKSVVKVARALEELDEADYLSSGGLGYLPDEGYSLNERGRELLLRAGLQGHPQPIEEPEPPAAAKTARARTGRKVTRKSKEGKEPPRKKAA